MVVGVMRLTGGDASRSSPRTSRRRSLVIGYTLGVVITFITVVIASLRVSHLNIVAAIRGVDEERSRENAPRNQRGSGSPSACPRCSSRRWASGSCCARASAWRWAWFLGRPASSPACSCILAGESNGEAVLLRAGHVADPARAWRRWRGTSARRTALTWTLVGALLAAYWLMPSDLHDRLFGKMDGNIEMFVLSGIMIVTALHPADHLQRPPADDAVRRAGRCAPHVTAPRLRWAC